MNALELVDYHVNVIVAKQAAQLALFFVYSTPYFCFLNFTANTAAINELQF